MEKIIAKMGQLKEIKRQQIDLQQREDQLWSELIVTFENEYTDTKKLRDAITDAINQNVSI